MIIIKNCTLISKEPSKLYDQNITGALTDFFEKSNDTLNFKLNTKPVEDYGTLPLFLINAIPCNN
jgi:hypothetical protein